MNKAIVAKNFEELTEPVWGGQCAALVQYYGCNYASKWRQGATVRGNTLIRKGTCVATFENGRYPNRKTGNHAAIYVSQSAEGIRVYDQWSGRSPGHRTMAFLPGMTNPSNNGNCLSVILTEPNTGADGYKDAELADNPQLSPRALSAVRTMSDPQMRNLLSRALLDDTLSFEEVAALCNYVIANRRNLAGYADMLMILSHVRTMDPNGKALIVATIHACIAASAAPRRR